MDAQDDAAVARYTSWGWSADGARAQAQFERQLAESFSAGTTASSSGGLRLVSRIGEHAGLARHASRLSGTVQESIDHLTSRLGMGHMNPGSGTKHLFGSVFEARARDGARVYFQRNGDVIEILGKSTKENQSQVINILRDLYN